MDGFSDLYNDEKYSNSSQETNYDDDDIDNDFVGLMIWLILNVLYIVGGCMVLTVVKSLYHDPPTRPGERRACGLKSWLVCCCVPCGWIVAFFPIDVAYDPLTDPLRLYQAVPVATPNVAVGPLESNALLRYVKFSNKHTPI